MMNKKGVSIGRIILYVLFLTLLGFLVYGLFVTFKAIKDGDNTTPVIQTNIIKKQDYNDNVIRNLYNNVDYPFVNMSFDGSSNSTRLWTGCYIFCPLGTYTVTFYDLDMSVYKFAVQSSSLPTYDISHSYIYDSGWITSSNSFTFTLTSSDYVGFFISKVNGGNISTDLNNSIYVMFNTGSISYPYEQYDSNFANATSYISDCYVTGYTSFVLPEFFGQYNVNGSVSGYIPITNMQDYESTSKTSLTTYVYDSSDLFIGRNITNAYNATYNTSYSGYYYTYHISYSYADTLKAMYLHYSCSQPIPIAYFNFQCYGLDLRATSTCHLSITYNDNQSVSIPFDSSLPFDSQSILDVAPNANYINDFSFLIFTYDDYSNMVCASRAWSYYSSTLCNLHIVFKNYYGNEVYQLGYIRGYSDGQAAADAGLISNNEMLQSDIQTLNSQVSALQSTINQQSSLIDSLSTQLNQLQEGQFSLKNIFFTFADIPFKTAHNVLDFQFFGVNLFHFFVGVITALGMIWLIKKII